MMNSIYGRLTSATALVLSCALLVSAAGDTTATPVPDLTAGGKIDAGHDWTLGPTGARGWVCRTGHSTVNSRQIHITKVEAKSPADGVLRVGDVILGVNGALFKEDARKAFAKAITEAETAEKGGRLTLLRWREGAKDDVTVTVKVMGSFSPTAPYNCLKSEKIVERAVEALKEDGLDNNTKPVDGEGIAGAINALGLMATGRRDVMPLVEARVKELAKEPIDGMKWGHAWTLLTLAEYYLLTNDASVLPAVKRYACETARGQSIAGTWGHGFADADGILGGYGSLNQLAIFHTMGLLLAQKCGVNDPVVREAIDKSTKFFAYYVGKGAVPYGDHEAGLNFGTDDNGKSSGCAIFFNLYGDKAATEFFARMGLADYDHIEEGHASTYFHLLLQDLASAHLGVDAAAAHVRECLWYYELLRDWRGKFRHHEDPVENERDEWWDATGARLLLFSLPRKNLYLTGKGGYLADAVRGKELEAFVESGRNHQGYPSLPTEQLFTKLGDWSPVALYRAAQALAQREGDWVPRCMKLFQEGTLAQKYGAAHVFEELKDGKAAPAVDLLIEALQHPDLGLRIRAVKALHAMGTPALKAVPALMAAVNYKDPADTYAWYRTSIMDALFDPERGLLRNDAALATVPADKLVPVLKTLLKHEEARSVGLLQRPLKKLSFEQLQPLWPEIAYRIEHRCSMNVMFECMQSICLDLMADHNVEEGLDLAAYMIMTQNGWGAGDRDKNTVSSVLKYGTHAKRMIFPFTLYLTKNVAFSESLQEFKEKANGLTNTPPLRSIAPWLGGYVIGDEYEKQVVMAELRKKIAADDLAQYWETHDLCRKLLATNPSWSNATQAVQAELMAIPRAADIVQAHLALEAIKQSFKDATITKEQAIEQLSQYKNKYDIKTSGPNLVYWYASMWRDSLVAGNKL